MTENFHNFSTLAQANGLSRDERLALLRSARLYLCTDARTHRGDLAEFLDAAYSGGVDIIQLRDKTLSPRDEIEALLTLKAIAQKHGKLFAVNDRADIAALLKADIFHTGQSDLNPTQARLLLGQNTLIGLSTHNQTQADQAIAHPNVDYFACGPVWETPTKPGRPATGLSYLTYVAQQNTSKPWFAIGNINTHTLPEVQATGANRIVVVRAITQATNPHQAAQTLKKLLDQ